MLKLTKQSAIVSFLFVGIVLLGTLVRLTGVNWDQGNHLHPDERFLTMVGTDTQWPTSIAQYFDTSTSPLNPQNKNFSFFVYGTFPLFFVKFIASALGLADYGNLILVGRTLSALTDIGTMILVFFFAKRIFSFLDTTKRNEIALLSMFLYATTALAIQLSHFYAVEPYLAFFLLLTLYASYKTGLRFTPLSGIAMGLAIASKITAVFILPALLVSYLLWFIHSRNIKHAVLMIIVFGITCYITVRIFQPYLFATGDLFSPLNPKVLANWKELESWNSPLANFPPGIQWIHTMPLIFPLENLLLWGLGLPLGLLSLGGMGYWIATVIQFAIHPKQWKAYKKTSPILLLPLGIFVLTTIGYQGMQFVKALRYFYPMLPMLSIITGWAIVEILRPVPYKKYIFVGILTSVLMWPAAFVSLYTKPHTRVTASEWIYTHIPQNSSIALEHWDDPLPLCLPTGNCADYRGTMLPLYNPDSPEKWNQIKTILMNSDYIIETSNRLYGSLSSAPEKYPIATQYYQKLFDGSLGYEKVAEFVSRPNLPIPGLHACLTPAFISYGKVSQSSDCTEEGISFVDDYADETWTVYDHPKVTIFKKIDPTKLQEFLPFQ